MHKVILKNKLTKFKKSGTYSRLLRKYRNRFKNPATIVPAEVDPPKIDNKSEEILNTFHEDSVNDASNTAYTHAIDGNKSEDNGGIYL